MKYGVFSLMLVSCASLPKKPVEQKAARELSLPSVVAPKNAQTFSAPYKIAKKSESVEVFVCDNETANSVLLNHSDKSGWTAQNFCSSWVAQIFLKNGFNVIGVNRPGFGQSTGKKDLAGPRSSEAIKTATTLGLSKLKTKSELVGSWGLGSGGISAGLVARNFKSMKWVILGNTVYDFEQQLTNTKSKIFNPEMSQLKKIEGESAVENRSIAFEIEKLPKQIYLYHSATNEEVGISQMTQFVDSLTAQQFTVATTTVESSEQELNDVDQYNVVRDFLTSIK